MRIYCLNGDQNYPCFVLTIKGCKIMFDCALDMRNIEHFFPVMLVQHQRYEHMMNYKLRNGKIIENIKEYNNRIFINSMLEFSPPEFNLIHIEDIDAVVISNHNSMLALPFLTKMKQFRGVIYCTEPTLHLGRLLMEEMTTLLKSGEKICMNSINNVILSHEESWKNYSILLSQLLNINETHYKPHNWCPLYTRDDVDLCISKVKQVNFNQKLDLFGSLTLIPTSSGHSIGSCNWSVEADCDRILYLANSSILTTHSKLIDQSCLKNQIIDCLIVSGINRVPNEAEAMMKEFCKAVVATIKGGGNVLVPTLPSGKIYDLIEYLMHYLAESQLSTTPVYFISSIANQSLAYSNIFAEWLCDTKQNLVYAAESPFSHGELVKNGQLKIYPSINGKFNDDYKTPCIIFASHPSLRFGEVCHFVELWKNSQLNSFIFTDPLFNYFNALAPFQPVCANYYYFPIDTNLTSNDLNKIIKECKSINQVIIGDNISINNSSVNHFHQNDIIKLRTKRKYEQCNIEAELANSLILKPNQAANCAYSTFSAHLVTKNNQHILKAAPKTIPLTRRDRLDESNLKQFVYGKINIQELENNLRQFGLSRIKTTSKYSNQDNVYQIEINSQNSLVVNPANNSISIVTDNEDIRNKIKDAFLKCLNTL